MTRLRVLSGRHAGVSIDFSSSQLVVGNSEENDVFIGDWNAQTIELGQDAQGRVIAFWTGSVEALPVPGQQAHPEGWSCLLQDWQPVRFGAIIVCVGPQDQEWPDDADLLQRCFARPLAPAKPAAPSAWRSPRVRSGLVIAAVCCALALVSPWMVRGSEASSPHNTMAPVQLAQAAMAASGSAAQAANASPKRQVPSAAARTVTQLEQLLDSAALASVTPEASAQRVVVRGVLSSRSQVDLLNKLLDSTSFEVPVLRRFVSAQEVVERLYESLPKAKLAVRHVKGSSFEIDGQTADSTHLAAAIAHIAADMAEFGVTVHSMVAPANAALPSVSGTLVDGYGTSFLRTRDGVKHIVSSGAAVPRGAAGAAAPQAPTGHPMAAQDAARNKGEPR
jgi:type III secretion protein D